MEVVFDMGKKQNKNYKNTKDRKDTSSNVNTIDGQIMTQAIIEAYRIIEERKKIENKNVYDKQTDKEKWYIKALFVLNVIFWPWKVNKRFSINNQIYDSILVLFVTLMLGLFGVILWLLGLLAIVYAIVILFKDVAISEVIGILCMSIVVMMFGSIFALAANEFSKVSDSNRIYAYSASVIALISCIIAIISLIKEYF